MKGWVAVLILGAILGVIIACVLTSGYVERQGELGQVIAERDSAQADAAAERVSSDAMGQELVNKDEQIQSANSERDQANAENEGDSAQIASLNTQVSDLSSHVSSLMLQLNTANQNFDSKSAEVTRLIEQNNTLQTQLDQSRQDDSAAVSRIQNLEAENQRLRDEYQAQVQRIAVLEASIAQSQICGDGRRGRNLPRTQQRPGLGTGLRDPDYLCLYLDRPGNWGRYIHFRQKEYGAI